MSRYPVLFLCGLAVALPAVALAGPASTAGDQSLQLSGSITPNKASPSNGARGVVLKLHVAYESLNQGAQVKEVTKQVAIKGPSGLKFHPDRAAVCKVSDMLQSDANGQPVGPSACPQGSQIGSGTATADARPAVPQPVPATVQIINGSDDVNPDGTPRTPGTPSVVLYAKTNIGATSILPFDIDGSRLHVDFAPLPPGQTQPYHIQTVDVTLPNRGGSKAYVTAPRRCGSTHRWAFSMTVSNYDGPTVTARHSVRCRKA